MKVVIPVAGFGSRMLPATKAIPKELMPLIDKPLIQYVVEECAAAGFTDIVLVSHSSKSAIEDHFDTQFELEHSLAAKGKDAILSEVTSTLPKGINVMSVRQHYAKGLGHAVLCAKQAIGDQPFAVVLPDVLMNQYACDLAQDNMAHMHARFNETGASQVMLEEVPKQKVSAYGIADLSGAALSKGEFTPIKAFVEKPDVDKAPSNLAVVGRYIFSAAIWKKLEQVGVGAGGEIQLTDAMDMLLEDETVEAYSMVGKSHDCGNKEGYTKTFVEYAMNHETLGASIIKQIEEQTNSKTSN